MGCMLLLLTLIVAALLLYAMRNGKSLQLTQHMKWIAKEPTSRANARKT